MLVGIPFGRSEQRKNRPDVIYNTQEDEVFKENAFRIVSILFSSITNLP